MIDSRRISGLAALAALLLAAIPMPAAGGERLEERMLECAEIAGSFKRLDCFDAVAREFGKKEGDPETGEAGEWLVEEKNSGIGEARDVYMVLRAVEKIPGEEDPVRPILIVRCESNNTAVIFNFARFIEQSRAEATMRIDDGGLLAASLKMSASGKAFGFWQGDDAIPFAKRLFGGKRLFVQVTPFGSRPVVAEFPVEGFEAASASLRKACGW